MKVKKGFVTNSSSSNFVIVGRRIEPDSPRKLDPIFHYLLVGDPQDDGEDVIELTPEMIELLEQEGYKQGELYEVLASGKEYAEIDPDELQAWIKSGKKIMAIGVNKDYYPTEDLEVFRRAYVKGLGLYNARREINEEEKIPEEDREDFRKYKELKKKFE